MSSRKLGFSLIEVTIALAIFTTAVLVLTQGMLNGLTCKKSGETEFQKEESISFVRKNILSQKTREKAEEGNIESPFHGKSSWKAEITEADVLDLFKVGIRMEFEKPLYAEKNKYKETIYVLKPSWSDSTKRQHLLEDRKKILEEIRDSHRME